MHSPNANNHHKTLPPVKYRLFVYSFYYRDAEAESTGKLTVCMNNRADWVARRKAQLRPPEWISELQY